MSVLDENRNEFKPRKPKRTKSLKGGGKYLLLKESLFSHEVVYVNSLLDICDMDRAGVKKGYLGLFGIKEGKIVRINCAGRKV